MDLLLLNYDETKRLVDVVYEQKKEKQIGRIFFYLNVICDIMVCENLARNNENVRNFIK